MVGGDPFTEQQKEAIVTEIERYKDVIESNATEKTSSNATKKNELFETFAKTITNNERTAAQVRTFWNNIKTRTTRKLRQNEAERKKTGGGQPNFQTLTSLESKVSEIIQVATPIAGVLDSNISLNATDLNESTTWGNSDVEEVQNTNEAPSMPPKMPKTDTKAIHKVQAESSKVNCFELQSNLMALDDIRKSHLNSLKCINEIHMVPQPLTDEMNSIRLWHIANVQNTGSLLSQISNLQ